MGFLQMGSMCCRAVLPLLEQCSRAQTQWFQYGGIVIIPQNTRYQPRLSKISLKHIAAGSSRASEKQPPRSEQWIYVSFCLAAQRKSCGGDEYWAETGRRNSARVLGMKTSSAVGEIRQRQRMKEVTCNWLGRGKFSPEKSSSMKRKTVVEDRD